jgi:hypothetical protein
MWWTSTTQGDFPALQRRRRRLLRRRRAAEELRASFQRLSWGSLRPRAIHCVAFVCYMLHTSCGAFSRLIFSLLTVLQETLCQGKGLKGRSVTINPHPSHCWPSWESKSFEFFHISFNSLMYQKAKNVENGLTHFTRIFAPVRRIASTKALS